MKQLMLQLIFFFVTAIKCFLTIFGIARQRMSRRSKMRTDLMSAPRNQTDFEKCHLSVVAQRLIYCLDRLCIFLFLPVDRYFIQLCVFVQITSDVFLFTKDALYNTEVFLMYRPVME